jgi:hypothetical protein
MRVLKGKEKKDFSELIRYNTRQPEPCEYNYISRGFYDEQIERYEQYFDENQMLIIQSTDLRNNTQETLDIVCNFLGLKPFTYRQIKTKKGTVPKYRILSWILSIKYINYFQRVKAIVQKLNKGEPYPPMKEEDKKYLEEIYEETKSKMYMAFK